SEEVSQGQTAYTLAYAAPMKHKADQAKQCPKPEDDLCEHIPHVIIHQGTQNSDETNQKREDDGAPHHFPMKILPVMR
ncbi:hypothetical protein, partial [Lysinibacillus sp. GbtcB16]|uniref:hypothetical protein n=1 Tax=Lysinibacillus sp. GbtcB16 TaxID=2824761 RepID=UPI001C307BC9